MSDNKDMYYEGRINSIVGQLYLQDSRLFEAEVVLGKALHQTRNQKDILGQIYSLFSLSYLESNFGQHLEALELVREGLDLCNSYNYLEKLSIGYFHQGRLYWALGDLNIALKYCNLAIASMKLAIVTVFWSEIIPDQNQV